MNRRDVGIVRTGSANLASVAAAFSRLGASVRFVEDAAAVRSADFLTLPGVGSFSAARAGLRAKRLDDAIRQRVNAQRPTLGICLGLQLLAARSVEAEEAGRTNNIGLGVLPVDVVPLPSSVTLPQLGWNAVTADAGCQILQSGTAYFAHSFALSAEPPGWAHATTTHGIRYVSAVERGPVVACQFHPELSGAWGASLLRRWIDTSKNIEVFTPEGRPSC